MLLAHAGLWQLAIAVRPRLSDCGVQGFYNTSYNSAKSTDKAAHFCRTAHWAGSAQCLQGSYNVFDKAACRGFFGCRFDKDHRDKSAEKAARYYEDPNQRDPTACLKSSYDFIYSKEKGVGSFSPVPLSVDRSIDR